MSSLIWIDQLRSVQALNSNQIPIPCLKTLVRLCVCGGGGVGVEGVSLKF